MSAVLDKIIDVQDSVVEFVGQAKEPITNGVQTVVEFVLGRFPEVPAAPFADQLPTPTELINAQYDFATKLIDANKDLASSVAKAAAPLTDKLLDRPVKAAAKKAAPKAAAKKAAPKAA